MGFEGHVFDMIQRTKQNRKMLQDRRDRTKHLREKMSGKSRVNYPDMVSEEKLDQIRKDIFNRERDEKMYYSRFTVYFIGSMLLIVLIVFGIWKLL